MKRLLRLVALAIAELCAITAHAVPVTPATIPRITFVNASGAPCAGCQLYTYSAGTTTALATYVDATGTSVNTNPIVLDVAGGANIWLGRNSYKFILKDALGSTIWTVDQVNAATLFPCSPANTIQIANAGVNGLTCDSNITIDTINHTLNVGVMSVNHVTIGALSTPTSWFFDTTSPATACASIGCSSATGTVTNVSVVTANGVSATVANPTTTPALTFTLGAITPSSIALAGGSALTGNQGNGAKVQHSTGSTTTDDCAKFDVNGNVVDAGSPCTTAISGTDYYFSFTGCTLAVSGNSTNCQGNATFSSVSPVVPTQPDANYYLGCTTNTGVAWGSSTGINSQSATGFQFAENVDRYNGIPATVTPTVWCHLHHN